MYQTHDSLCTCAKQRNKVCYYFGTKPFFNYIYSVDIMLIQETGEGLYLSQRSAVRRKHQCRELTRIAFERLFAAQFFSCMFTSIFECWTNYQQYKVRFL